MPKPRKLNELSHAELVAHATWLGTELEKADVNRIVDERLREDLAEWKEHAAAASRRAFEAEDANEQLQDENKRLRAELNATRQAGQGAAR